MVKQSNHNSAAESLLFTGKTALLMKNSFFSKMAGDRGISLLCFFEVEVILEVLNGLYMDDN